MMSRLKSGKADTSDRIKAIVKTAGRILFVLSIIFVIVKIHNMGFDPAVIDDIPVFIAMAALAVFLNMLSTLVLALAWGGWIALFSSLPVDKADAVTIYGKSAIGKYLPGNVMHYVERNLFASEYGLSQKKIMISTIMEIMVMIISGILLSVCLLPFSYFHKVEEVLGVNFLSVILVFAGGLSVAVICCILVFRKRNITKMIGEYKLFRFAGTFLGALLAGTGCLLLNGAGMCALWWGLDSAVCDLQSMRHILSAFSMAWVCGFVIPGAPGGIGVREAVLTVLLESIIDGPGLAVILIVHRITSIAGDFIFYVVVSAGRKFSHSKKA